MATTRGRPRASGSSNSGLGTEADILRAAATLFCTVGYGSTSTHAIAREAGVRQASMYHYFAAKHEILLALLRGTVRPSIDAASELLTRDEAAEVRLWALCALDARLLASGPDNLGSLYLLPELNDPKLAEFHAMRDELRAAYRSLVSGCVSASVGDVAHLADMVLALVESVILRRRQQPDVDIAGLAPSIADAALRILALDADLVRAAGERGAALAAELSA